MPLDRRAERKVRVQFDLTEQAVEDLESLSNRIKAGSRAETVRRALKLLDATTQAEARGRKLVLRGENGEPDEVLVLI